MPFDERREGRTVSSQDEGNEFLVRQLRDNPLNLRR
jgi:hypothetical protein